MSIGYYLYSKGPKNVRDSKALPVTATELYKAFSEDPPLAQIKFSGKVLLVSGTVVKIDSNQQNESIVFLRTTEPGASINCSMEQSNPGLQLHETATIKGLCSGMGQGDADLGLKADVYLTRCRVAK